MAYTPPTNATAPAGPSTPGGLLPQLGTIAEQAAKGDRLPLALALALLVLSYLVFAKARAPRSAVDALPILGARPGELFPYLRAAWRNTVDLAGSLRQHRRHHADAPGVRVPLPGPGRLVLLPAREAPWLLAQPEAALSMHAQTALHFQVQHGTVYPVPDQAHVRLVATTLTRRVARLVPALADEIAGAVAAQWDDEGGDDHTKKGERDDGGDGGWREVGVYDTLRVVVGRVTNRVCLGAPLCRDAALLDAGVAYAQAVPVAAQVLSLFPPMLRPLVAPLVTRPNRRYEREWFRLVRPEVERRLRVAADAHAHAVDGSSGDDDATTAAAASEEDTDFLDWSIAAARDDPATPSSSDPETLAARVLLVNAAAVHTASFAITHALLDLAGAGPVRGGAYVATLRAEAATALAVHGDGVWSAGALAALRRLDSALRESQRLNTVLAVGPLRIVTAAPAGVVTPSGLRLPPGCQVGVPAYAMHTDPAVWGADALEFQPFRFVAADDDDEGEGDKTNPDGDHNDGGVPKKEKEKHAAARPASWTTTSAQYLSFGGGRNSCPGRFFAAAEIKLLLAHILLNYDIEFQELRPANQWFGASHLPPTKATLRVRKRATPFSL